MKVVRILTALTLIWVAFVNNSYGAFSAASYPLTFGSGTLDDMTGATGLLTAGNVDDDASAVTNIGFSFDLDGTAYTQFSVNANGLMRLGGTAVSTAFTNSLAATTDNPKIAGLWDDLCTSSSGGGGLVQYKLSGSPGSQKLVVEWKNMKRRSATCSTVADNTMTFQVWLTEGSNRIDFVYGSFGTVTGLTYSTGLATSSTNFASVTAAASPTVSYAAANNSNAFTIPDGTRYTFLPSPPSIYLSDTTYSVSEAGPNAVITVNRSGPTTGTASVDVVTSNGSATSPADFTGGTYTASFAIGSSTATVNIPIVDDATPDPGESFGIALQNATGGPSIGTPSAATVYIVDNEPLPGGAVTVGTGGTFNSLTNPGGVFDALNTTPPAASVTINVLSDLSGENGVIALNELPSGTTVSIRPSGGARSITGSSTNSIIRLNGADDVTIDGSLSGQSAIGVGGIASIRNLTVTNTNPTATAGAVLAVMQGPNAANNITIKNVNVVGQDPTQTLIGIHVGGNAIGTSPTTAPNTNVVIDNCSFQKSFIAIFNNGVTGTPATGSVISHNDMSAAGANRLRRAGIFFFNQNGIRVFENSIGGIVGDEGADAIGIIAGVQNVTNTVTTAGGVTNAIIERNKISGVTSTNTTGFSAVGIAVAGDTGGQNVIRNNMITNVSAPSTSPDLVAGIFVAGVTGSNTALYHNSVALTGDRGAVASQIGSYGIAITGTNPVVELKNNIFYTTQTSGGGANAQSYAIGTVTTAAAMSNISSDYNDFWSTGANDGGFRTGSLGATGTDFVDLPAWRTATGKDLNSFEVDPLFVDPLSNLHLQAASPMINVATYISSVNDDYDGQARLGTRDIGADERVTAGAGEQLYATTGTEVTSFNSLTPAITTTVTITGMQSGERIVDWDVRPLNGQLFGIGSTSRMYSINPATGVATLVGSPGAFTLNGAAFGVDFNPTVDRIRVISDTEQNLRLNPTNGALAGTDTNLAPSGTMVSAAYDRNDNLPSTPTTLYAIDSAAGTLVLIGGPDGVPSPNGGVVTVIGSLGLGTNLDPAIGFDISGQTGIAYATISDSGIPPKPGDAPDSVNPRLYTINLSTGQATLVGTIGNGSGGAYPGLTVATAPTASGVSIAGRVLTSDGRGLTNAKVTLMGMNGSSQTVITGRSGAFEFADVTAGQTYIISIGARRFSYSPQTVNVTDNVADLIFTPEGGGGGDTR